MERERRGLVSPKTKKVIIGVFGGILIFVNVMIIFLIVNMYFFMENPEISNAINAR